MWDARSRGAPALSVADAHASDVNVVSWSRLASCMLGEWGKGGGGR